MRTIFSASPNHSIYNRVSNYFFRTYVEKAAVLYIHYAHITNTMQKFNQKLLTFCVGYGNIVTVIWESNVSMFRVFPKAGYLAEKPMLKARQPAGGNTVALLIELKAQIL